MLAAALVCVGSLVFGCGAGGGTAHAVGSPDDATVQRATRQHACDGCDAAEGPAENVLRRFGDELADRGEPLEPEEFHVARTAWSRVEAAVVRVLLPAKDELHLRARWELERLRPATGTAPRQQPRQAGWQPTAEALTRDPAATWQSVIEGTESKNLHATNFLLGWSPVRAFTSLRTHLLVRHFGPAGFMRRTLLEAFAPPTVVWVGGDAHHPELATSTPFEWIAVRFAYDESQGIYRPERITWLRQPAAPAAPAARAAPAPAARSPRNTDPAEQALALAPPVGICAAPPENLTKALMDPACALDLATSRAPLSDEVELTLSTPEVHALPGQSAPVLVRVDNKGSEAELLDVTFCTTPLAVTVFDAQGALAFPGVCQAVRARVRLAPKSSHWLAGEVRAVDERTGETLAPSRPGETPYRFVVSYKVGLQDTKTFEGRLIVSNSRSPKSRSPNPAAETTR